MKNAPGYPLPAGELGSDDIVCQLVYLPDRPEYWQAFYAALHYMTTWRAWERDDEKRGSDAASNWREAFELTSGCWRMECLEQLQDDVAAILALMEIPQSCCDPGDITDGDRYTDRVEDGEGDVPQNIIDAGYADDAADWAGFDDYKCMIANVTVYQLEAKLNEIAPLVDATGAILGGVAALSGILAVIVGTGGLAIVFGIVVGIGATSLLYQALTNFDWVDGLADKVAANHAALTCAIYQADGDVGALIALNDEIDNLFTAPEALILKNMNLGPTLKMLYAGRYDQQDIADVLSSAGYDVESFECCAQIGEYVAFTDFETGTFEGWDNTDAELLTGEGMGGGWGVKLTYSPGAYLSLYVSEVGDLAGVEITSGQRLLIRRVKIAYTHDGSASTGLFWVITHNTGTRELQWGFHAGYSYEEYVVSPEYRYNYNGIFAVQIGVIGAGGHVIVDNITIDFDVEDY